MEHNDGRFTDSLSNVFVVPSTVLDTFPIFEMAKIQKFEISTVNS